MVHPQLLLPTICSSSKHWESNRILKLCTSVVYGSAIPSRTNSGESPPVLENSPNPQLSQFSLVIKAPGNKTQDWILVLQLVMKPARWFWAKSLSTLGIRQRQTTSEQLRRNLKVVVWAVARNQDGLEGTAASSFLLLWSWSLFFSQLPDNLTATSGLACPGV